MSLSPNGSYGDDDDETVDEIEARIEQHPLHGRGWWWTVKPSKHSYTAYTGYGFTKGSARRQANRQAKALRREADAKSERWTV